MYVFDGKNLISIFGIPYFPVLPKGTQCSYPICILGYTLGVLRCAQVRVCTGTYDTCDTAGFFALTLNKGHGRPWTHFASNKDSVVSEQLFPCKSFVQIFWSCHSHCGKVLGK